MKSANPYPRYRTSQWNPRRRSWAWRRLSPSAGRSRDAKGMDRRRTRGALLPDRRLELEVALLDQLLQLGHVLFGEGPSLRGAGLLRRSRRFLRGPRLLR